MRVSRLIPPCMSIFLLWLPLISEEKEVKKIPDFSLMERCEVPEAFTWRIEDIYETTGHWNIDRKSAIAKIAEIDRIARGWTRSPVQMLALLDHVDELKTIVHKLFYYTVLRCVVETSNCNFLQMKGQIEALQVQLKQKTAFMEHDILELGTEGFSRFLRSENRLATYRFMIEKILKKRDHILPADRQEIVSLAGLMSGVAEQAYGFMSDLEIPPVEVTLANGQVVLISNDNYDRLCSLTSPEDRTLVTRTFWKNYERFSKTMASLLDGGIREHLFYSRVHKYEDCLDSRLAEENIDPQIYRNLIRYVRENLAPLHRFLLLKKELLGLDTMRFEDIYAEGVPEGKGNKYPFAEAREMMLNMMAPLGETYIKGLRKAFAGRWIDIYPHRAKTPLAGSGFVYGVHPYLVINFKGDYNSLTILAHELGHAMHYYFSNHHQAFCNTVQSLFLTEIAASFNEHVLIHYLLKKERDDLFRLYLIHSYLDVANIALFRSTLLAELELAMHRRVEEGDTLTADWLNNKYLELCRFYYGHDEGILRVDEFFRAQWGRIPKLFRNYYLFTYCTGDIASVAMADVVLNGFSENRERYLDFLKAGSSRYSLDLLAAAGVDLTTAKPFQAAFNRFDALVREMDRIMQRLKKQGKLKIQRDAHR